MKRRATTQDNPEKFFHSHHDILFFNSSSFIARHKERFYIRVSLGNLAGRGKLVWKERLPTEQICSWFALANHTTNDVAKRFGKERWENTCLRAPPTRHKGSQISAWIDYDYSQLEDSFPGPSCEPKCEKNPLLWTNLDLRTNWVWATATIAASVNRFHFF